MDDQDVGLRDDVGGEGGGAFVEKFDGCRAMPLDVYDGDGLLGNDAFDLEERGGDIPGNARCD